jgi:GNAT superfamily N-acetyltransferase
LAGRANGGQGPNHDEILHFGFGFALLVDDKIGYFRVQNHLRKAGLGRKALAKLLDRYRDNLLPRKSPNSNEPIDVGYELLEVPTTAFEVPTDKDKERFRRLYRSVSFTVAKTEP